MREQGIDFPDPEYAGGAGVVIETGPHIDLTDRNVRETRARCAPFRGTSWSSLFNSWRPSSSN
jgi:hypothetical protein